jgi:hypothetical protein
MDCFHFETYDVENENSNCLYTYYFRIKQTYDTVDRNTLRKVLDSCEISTTLLNAIKSLRGKTNVSLITDQKKSTHKPLFIKTGLRQVCWLVFLSYSTYKLINGRSQWPRGHWDRGFEPRSRHGCLSFVGRGLASG